MIGSSMVWHMANRSRVAVFGVARDPKRAVALGRSYLDLITYFSEYDDDEKLLMLFKNISPDVVINCIGLTKHLPEGNLPTSAIFMNALLPHRLAECCQIINARYIQISTDCVFSGVGKGNYTESDNPDAMDLYGRTKILGEVYGPNCLTIRTSTVGHEIQTRNGLLQWFLSQQECDGYVNAIFSGLTSDELATTVRDYILADPKLSGLYHVGGHKISKLALLSLINEAYNSNVIIKENVDFVIDRSLDSSKFQLDTGYVSPPWRQLINTMLKNHLERCSRV